MKNICILIILITFSCKEISKKDCINLKRIKTNSSAIKINNTTELFDEKNCAQLIFCSNGLDTINGYISQVDDTIFYKRISSNKNNFFDKIPLIIFEMDISKRYYYKHGFSFNSKIKNILYSSNMMECTKRIILDDDTTYIIKHTLLNNDSFCDNIYYERFREFGYSKKNGFQSFYSNKNLVRDTLIKLKCGFYFTW